MPAIREELARCPGATLWATDRERPARLVNEEKASAHGFAHIGAEHGLSPVYLHPAEAPRFRATGCGAMIWVPHAQWSDGEREVTADAFPALMGIELDPRARPERLHAFEFGALLVIRPGD